MIELVPYPMNTFLAGAFLALLTFVLFLNIFGLPANWIILVLDVLWKFADPGNPGMSWLFWSAMLGLALLGEALEFILQVAKARKYGSTSSGSWGGMIGAIIGAIALAPLFWGLGAFIGALAGAWLGCFVMERLKGRSSSDSIHAAFGTMLGRFLGTVCKIGTGAAMVAITGRIIWPDAPVSEEDMFLTLAFHAAC